jgi:hypothetical protein
LPFAVLGISGGVRGLQRAVGNRATQRLLTSSTARKALLRPTYRVLARQDDDQVTITRDFTLQPFVHPMEGSAEREYDQPPVVVPDFSGDTPANALSSLEPGDHVWYWDGTSSTAGSIPRDDWFPGHTANPLDYLENGGHIYNFVVYPGGQWPDGRQAGSQVVISGTSTKPGVAGLRSQARLAPLARSRGARDCPGDLLLAPLAAADAAVVVEQHHGPCQRGFDHGVNAMAVVPP